MNTYQLYRHSRQSLDSACNYADLNELLAEIGDEDGQLEQDILAAVEITGLGTPAFAARQFDRDQLQEMLSEHLTDSDEQTSYNRELASPYWTGRV